MLPVPALLTPKAFRLICFNLATHEAEIYLDIKVEYTRLEEKLRLGEKTEGKNE